MYLHFGTLSGPVPITVTSRIARGPSPLGSLTVIRQYQWSPSQVVSARGTSLLGFLTAIRWYRRLQSQVVSTRGLSFGFKRCDISTITCRDALRPVVPPLYSHLPMRYQCFLDQSEGDTWPNPSLPCVSCGLALEPIVKIFNIVQILMKLPPFLRTLGNFPFTITPSSEVRFGPFKLRRIQNE